MEFTLSAARPAVIVPFDIFQRQPAFLRRVISITVAITLFLGSSLLFAEEIIHKRSGKLILSHTDVELPAGPVNLKIIRTLQPAQNRVTSLLGIRWRLNWEKRLIRIGSVVLLDEANGTVTFSHG